MAKKLTDKQKIDALYTLFLGVPGTAAGGVVKSLENIEQHLSNLNGSVKINTTWRKVFAWGLSILFTGMIVLIGYLLEHNIGG